LKVTENTVKLTVCDRTSTHNPTHVTVFVRSAGVYVLIDIAVDNVLSRSVSIEQKSKTDIAKLCVFDCISPLSVSTNY